MPESSCCWSDGWIGGRHGVDAQLAVFEGQTSWRAFEDASHFELTVHPRRVEEKDASEKDKATVETIDIPFRPGPFNWEDYASLGWFPLACDPDAIEEPYSNATGSSSKCSTIAAIRDAGPCPN